MSRHDARGRSSQVGWATTLILVAGLIVVCAQPTAQAASATRFAYQVVRISSRPLSAGYVASAAAHCPAKEKPLGGGVSTGSDDMRVVESYPIGDPQGWAATVANEGTSSASFDVYAICARTPRAVAYDVVSVASEPNASAGVAACPTGRSSLGGGVSVGSDELRVVESFPLGGSRGWVATVADQGSDNAAFEVFAVCAQIPADVAYEVVQVSSQPVSAGATATVVDPCPTGKVPLGGGVYAATDDVRLVESFPQGRERRWGWVGTVANESLTDSSIDIYVICAK